MANDEVLLEHAKQAVQEGFLTEEESKAWFNQMQETLYLLNSSSNAQRLMESIEQIKACEVNLIALDDLGAASK